MSRYFEFLRVVSCFEDRKHRKQGRRVEGTGNSASVTPAQRFSTAVDKIYNARGACGEPRAISYSFHFTSLVILCLFEWLK